MDNNHKTPEQIKQDKIKAFNNNPDEFLAISEIICCVVRNPNSQLGISAFIGNCKRSELNMAEGEIHLQFHKTRMVMDMQSQSKIVKPNKKPFYNKFLKR